MDIVKHFLLFISVIILLSSCKKDQDTSIIWGYEYFPINEGNYVVYDVVDIFHDVALVQHDTNIYQIKEVIGEEVIDGEGESSQKLRRFVRSNDTLNWQLQDVWTIKRTLTNAEVVNENNRVIKMAFAISYDQYWDCNALNNADEQQCYYDNIYIPLSIGGIDYDSTVRVEHQNFTSFIDYQRSYEIFAPGIGSVYSVKKDLQIDNYDTLDIQKGSELFYTAVEFGIE